MLTLLLGTDWVANREEILRRIARDVAEEKGGRILMVPELISHDTERRLCKAAGDTTSRFAEVLSFTRLARRVADAVGHAAPACLDDGGRVVAMASATRQLHSRLKAYASVETRPEFLTGLVDAVDEFKRCCISPADLMGASMRTEGSLAQKLEELALILECYDGMCLQGKRDPRDQMTWLLEELENSAFAENHTFYIDGFPDFTRQHMAIIEHLVRNCKNVTISMNCDCPDSSHMAFEKPGDTVRQLIACAKRWNVALEICTVAPRMDKLEVVRDQLFQGKISRDLTDGSLKVYHTETLYQECVAAVDRIMELVRGGARYRDIAVSCSDMAGYKVMLEMLLSRCHIPAYLSGTEDVLSMPVIRTVLSAIDTALSGFDQQDVLNYLKSVLSPVDLGMCDRIENYALTWGIDGKHWLKIWENHPGGLSGIWTQEARDDLQEMNDARKMALDPLVELQRGFRGAANLAEQVQSLYRFLDDINFCSRLDCLAQELDKAGDNRNAQILNQLWEIILLALEQLYDVLGQTAWDAETFSRLLRLLLSCYDVGTIPSVLDAVTVGPISAMRCQQIKHLLVLGAQEGNLPAYGSSSGVLTDQERTMLRELGVPLTGGNIDGLHTEFSEIYGVFCGAEDSVTVSYSGGQPSFVHRRLADIAGSEIAIEYDMGIALGDPLEAGAYLARFNAESAAELLGITDDYRKIRRHKLHALGEISHENIQKLYGAELRLSASQIDCQAQCRLSYFLKYGLRLKEQKTATVDPAEFGTYVHAVLENTASKVKELGGFHKVTLDETLRLAQGYSMAYAQEHFSQINAERLTYLFNRNAQELQLIVRELWEELQLSEFEPVGFEVGFGAGEEMPAIPISGQRMNGILRGFVDRVDSWNNGEQSFFRVVDYKTGKKDFDYCDVFNGIGLQMLLYLYALEQEGGALLGDAPVPAGVQYFPARVPIVSADGILTEEEAAAAREKLWKRKGLLLCDPAVLNAMEPADCPSRMPYSVKKDGSISGDLADRDQLAMLKIYIFGLLGNLIDDIASGCITPNPYSRGSSYDVCVYCPYDAVCHPETVECRRNYKTMSPERFWEEVTEEVGSHGGRVNA